MTSTGKSFSRVPWIGGPGTLLPRPVESFLSWMLAFSCLSVSGFHFLKTSILATPLYRLLAAKAWFPKSITAQEDSSLQSFPCWLPLTTFSCGEIARATALVRYKQLVQALQLAYKNRFGMDALVEDISDDGLVNLIRTNEICRRLATLAMRSDKTKTSNFRPGQRGTLPPSGRLPLGQRLIRLWPRLLELPRLDSCYPFVISLIIPCYREKASQLHRRLTATLENCMHPKHVQVVIVDAGHCEGLDDFLSNTTMKKYSCIWGEVKKIKYEGGGGRGGCLNFGAKHATGQILTFCHADTRLPQNWDFTIQQKCKLPPTQQDDDNDGQVIANSCAFQFGIDTSDVGLNGGPFPPGLRAIELTTNLRTRLYALPYGDQCLSLPSAIFHYIGGYPHQSLMEDYELIDLLRKRSLLLPTLNPHARKEGLAILGGKPVLCSPRRWQSFGVLYVTTMNSKIVNLYAGGLSADACYEMYYGRAPPATVTDDLSPWEDDLRRAII